MPLLSDPLQSFPYVKQSVAKKARTHLYAVLRIDQNRVNLVNVGIWNRIATVGEQMTHKITNIAKGCALALAASTGMAAAGGLDRSGQSIDILFESGNHAELSFGLITPSVTGVDFFDNPTGNMAPAYTIAGFGIKVGINEKLSFAVVYDQPFGASTEYGAGSGYAGMEAHVTSNALTALARYDVSDRIMVFGGASLQTVSADVNNPASPYTLDVGAGSGTGLVAGAAYQIPEMALRVALTYRSEITSTHDIVENVGIDIPGTIDITTPKSFNLEFQTGINPKTLVFGSVRWVNWSDFSVVAPFGGIILDYPKDVTTYSLGVGRKITDNFSAAVTAGYERAVGGGGATPLSPTDGNFSLGLGATYTMGATKITAGVRKVWLGDTTDVFAGVWNGNTAIAAGLSIGFDF